MTEQLLEGAQRKATSVISGGRAGDGALLAGPGARWCVHVSGMRRGVGRCGVVPERATRCGVVWGRCGVVPERATRLLAKANHHLRLHCSCAMLTAVVPRVPEVVHIREPRVDDGAGETVAIGAARLVAVEPRLVLITRVVKQPDDNAGAAEGVARPAACPHGVDVRKWVERWRWWRLSRWEWVGRWRRCRR
jgi:hypothetical protein